MSPPDLALLARLQAQLRRGLASGGEVRVTGAFAVYLWLHGDVFYRTRALPLRRPPRGWAAEVAAMVDVLRAAGRTPRLEILEELWPDLPPALLSAGPFVLVGEDRPILPLPRKSPWRYVSRIEEIQCGLGGQDLDGVPCGQQGLD